MLGLAFADWDEDALDYEGSVCICLCEGGVSEGFACVPHIVTIALVYLVV